jgi:hypothetical protein
MVVDPQRGEMSADDLSAGRVTAPAAVTAPQPKATEPASTPAATPAPAVPQAAPPASK